MDNNKEYRYDITNPVGVIFCSAEVFQHIKNETAYVPKSEMPQGPIMKLSKRLRDKLLGFLVSEDKVDMASVVIEEDPEIIRAMAVAPFPKEVLVKLIPWTLKQPVWKNYTVWGDLLDIGLGTSALYLSNFREKVRVTRSYTQSEDISEPVEPSKNKYYTVESILSLKALVEAPS